MRQRSCGLPPSHGPSRLSYTASKQGGVDNCRLTQWVFRYRWTINTATSNFEKSQVTSALADAISVAGRATRRLSQTVYLHLNQYGSTKPAANSVPRSRPVAVGSGPPNTRYIGVLWNRVKFPFILLASYLLLTFILSYNVCAIEIVNSHHWKIKGFAAALHDRDANTSLSALRSPISELILKSMHAEREYTAPGKIGEEVASLLANWLNSEHTPLRIKAAKALGALGPLATPYVHELLVLLNDVEWQVRKAAETALEELAHYIHNPVALVTAGLRHQTEIRRIAAARALNPLGVAKNVEASLLIEVLRDESESVREAVVGAIGKLGKHAQSETLPVVASLMRDNSVLVRIAAVRAIGKIGTKANEYVSLLAATLEDESGHVRAQAAVALAAFGPYGQKYTHLLANRLNDDRYWVRREAAEAIGSLAPYSSAHLPGLAILLNDGNPEIRASAVSSLAAFDTHAKDYVSLIADRLEDEDENVRLVAVKALGSLGIHSKTQAPALMKRLSDKYYNVREAAVHSLWSIGLYDDDLEYLLTMLLRDGSASVNDVLQPLSTLDVNHKQQLAPLIADRLDHGDLEVQIAAIRALGALSDQSGEYLPLLAQRLTHRIPRVRAATTEVLASFGQLAKQHVPTIAEGLEHENVHVRRATTNALRVFGEYNAEYAKVVVTLLNENDKELRISAIRALPVLEENPGSTLALTVANQLTAEEWSVQEAAVVALGVLGKQAKIQIVPVLAPLLHHRSSRLRTVATEALIKLGPLPVDLMPPIIENTYVDRSLTADVRYIVHLLGGGDQQVEELLLWAAGSTTTPLARTTYSRIDAIQTLKLFRIIWDATTPYDGIANDVAHHIGMIASSVSWHSGDDEILEWFYKKLLASEFEADAKSVNQEIEQMSWWELVLWIFRFLVAHAVFWLLLIFFYPNSSHIQAFFFWNRPVRKLAGFGYIDIILTWVPPLRRRLFAPFRDALLEDALFSEGEEENYFPGSLVSTPQGQLYPAFEAIPEIRGHIILEGESGIGKTMFLRQLASCYDRLIVFLLARDCKEGVVRAIQKKLEGPAKDRRYLNKLIYVGALDVVIDGVNEATANTRAEIVSFARQFRRGNILLTTQPILWTHPASFNVYVMQLLTEEQIEFFLISRYSNLLNSANADENTFGVRCKQLLQRELGSTESSVERDAILRVLSNPMDLTIIAQILAQGQTPSLFELQEQYFQVIASDYLRLRADGVAFPLKRFARYVYDLRVKDIVILGSDQFVDELALMERHKMVVRFERSIGDTDVGGRWIFRHDKILDYFLVQAFLGKGNELVSKHLDDSRFRGAYLLLADLLPLDAAEGLERVLVDYAADTSDHSVSDEFIRLLRRRRDG